MRSPQSPRPARFRRAALNTLLIFLIGIFVARLPATIAQVSGRAEFLDPIDDVQRALIADYVEQPDPTKLQTGAIRGMLEALGDDYAEYIPEEDAANFQKEMTGHFVGIGCQIEMRDGWLTVVSPLEDSPALAAGIMANDRITKVGDKSTFGLTADDCIKMLTGQPDTQVSFIVERDGKEIPFTITRAPIINRAVRGLRRVYDGAAGSGASGGWDYMIDPAQRIAYIRLSQFTPDAAAELAMAIVEARRQAEGDGDGKLGGLVLDLRNNPGGVMDGALEIADMFLEGGAIMSVRGRSPLGEQRMAGGDRAGGGGKGRAAPAETTYVAEADGTLPNFPMVVMINEGSASASEIVSGALSDHKRAVIVGTRSYGKGLVQTVSSLRHNPRAQVKFTTHRYYLPSGKLIQRTDESSEWGVDPTPGFFVPMTDAERIESFLKRREWDVLRKLEARPEADQPGAQPPVDAQKWSDPAWVREQAKDPQLAAALLAVQDRIALGDWKPQSDAAQAAGKLADKELHDLLKARDRLSLEFARMDKQIEALEKVATEGAAKPTRQDLWPDALDLTGGRVKVYDKDGKEVAELAVTGRDLERWLINADIRKSGIEAEPAGVGTEGTESRP